jgi:hypothetical protein
MLTYYMGRAIGMSPISQLKLTMHERLHDWTQVIKPRKKHKQIEQTVKNYPILYS